MLAFLGQGQATLSVIRGSLARSVGFRCSRIVKICISLHVLGLFPQRKFLTGLTPEIPGVGSRKYVDKQILMCCTSTSAVETSSFIDSFTEYF